MSSSPLKIHAFSYGSYEENIPDYDMSLEIGWEPDENDREEIMEAFSKFLEQNDFPHDKVWWSDECQNCGNKLKDGKCKEITCFECEEYNYEEEEKAIKDDG